jgi:hypothetical protein
MNAANIAVGVVLLLFGRRLFWLFVGAAGFIAGLLVTQEFFPGQQEWWVALIAILAGVMGALLSVFLQKVAVAVAGFLTGGYALMSLALALGHQALMWPAFLVGGILGAISILMLFDWALVILSSVAGAALIAQSIRADAAIAMGVFLVGIVAGVAIQASQLAKSTKTNLRPQAEAE